MKKLLLVALLATISATAQTNITLPAGNTISGGSGSAVVITVDAFGNGNIILKDQTNVEGNFSVNGSTTTNGLKNNGDLTNTGAIRTGAGGTNMAAKFNGYAEVTQNLYVGGYVFTNNIVGTSGAVQFNGATVSGVRAGVAGNDAVNINQLNATKLQTAQDIATAKTQAIQSAKTYTDSKIREVNDKIDLNAETAKLYTDKETERATNEELKINKRIDALELKIDNRFNAVMSYVGNEFQAVNNRIEGLGASMVALSAAATSSVYNANKPTNLNIATGVYGKATAIAIGMSHYFNAQTKLSVNYAAGSNTKNLVGIGVGFGF